MEDDTDVDYESSMEDDDDYNNSSGEDDKNIANSVFPRNALLKLFDRERANRVGSIQRRIYDQVPKRCIFHLISMIPQRLRDAGHIFMGLTACGQFMLSYTLTQPDENSAINYVYYINTKYTLYFWLFRPHQQLSMYYKCNLFDDHGVGGIKNVTMVQWKTGDMRILIVHGAAVDGNNESYITYIKVPKLGCFDCKKLRDSENCEYFRTNSNCLSCNLTVHTKYSNAENEYRFKPHVNLVWPGHIFLISNGCMHVLSVDIETPNETVAQPTANSLQLQSSAAAGTSQLTMQSSQEIFLTKVVNPRPEVARLGDVAESTAENFAARILADFTDIEIESNIRMNTEIIARPSHSKTEEPTTSQSNFIMSSETHTGSVNSGLSESSPPTESPRKIRPYRIVSKSFRTARNSLLTPTSTSTSLMSDKAKAYEFSEETEKCEKISTLRKRRLADRKYEFSEENSENILPFQKMRAGSRTTTLPTNTAQTSVRNVPYRCSPTPHLFCRSPSYVSPASSPYHVHSAISSEPRQNTMYNAFRTPPYCGSPASSTTIRSPNQVVQYLYTQRPLGALSPLQLTMAKRLDYFGNTPISPSNGSCSLSPPRDEMRLIEVPLTPCTVIDKPKCTKKLKRRYVDEDDAVSIITSIEDDCISPGYYTSLPMEVHGSCFSEMQMISQASYKRLRCPSVLITQHSFDLEAFTFYVISNICQKNELIYRLLHDWAYEPIAICPMSRMVSCLMVARFTASQSHDISAPIITYYECHVLFNWNMETGEWSVLDYGELKEHPNCSNSRNSIASYAQKLAKEISACLVLPDYTQNMRIHTSDIKRTKRILIDYDNLFEFHLKAPRDI